MNCFEYTCVTRAKAYSRKTSQEWSVAKSNQSKPEWIEGANKADGGKDQ